MKQIFKKNDGFTLAELLIVVAIIAVLVAVSIPIFTRQLEKARESTDLANMRAAKAAFITAYLSGDLDDYIGNCFYDAQEGILRENWGDVSATYGRGTTIPIPANDGTYPGYLTNEDYQDAVIVCTHNRRTDQLFIGWMRSEEDGWIGGDSGRVEVDPYEDVFAPTKGA